MTFGFLEVMLPELHLRQRQLTLYLIQVFAGLFIPCLTLALLLRDLFDSLDVVFEEIVFLGELTDLLFHLQLVQPFVLVDLFGVAL